VKTKTFDCVAWKNEIQQRMRAERGGLTWTKRNELLRAQLRSDPHLARFLDLQPAGARR